MYDYVIVDVDKRLGDLVLSILDHADEVHIVMTADLSCLKNVRLVLEALRKVGFDSKRLKLVLNRSNAFTGISVGAAESALKREFETKITNEYRVAISAQNTGSPFAYSKPDAPLSREIVELAHTIDAVVRAAGGGRGRRPSPAAGGRQGALSLTTAGVLPGSGGLAVSRRISAAP